MRRKKSLLFKAMKLQSGWCGNIRSSVLSNTKGRSGQGFLFTKAQRHAMSLIDPPRPLCSLCVPLSLKALGCFCFQQPRLAMLIWRTSLGLLEPLCPSTQKARSAWEFTSPKRMTEGIGVWNSGLLFWVKAPKHNLHSKSSPGGSSWCYLLWDSLKLHTGMALSSSQFYFPQCLIKSPGSTSLINHLHTNPLLSLTDRDRNRINPVS